MLWCTRMADSTHGTRKGNKFSNIELIVMADQDTVKAYKNHTLHSTQKECDALPLHATMIYGSGSDMVKLPLDACSYGPKAATEDNEFAFHIGCVHCWKSVWVTDGILGMDKSKWQMLCDKMCSHHCCMYSKHIPMLQQRRIEMAFSHYINFVRCWLCIEKDMILPSNYWTLVQCISWCCGDCIPYGCNTDWYPHEGDYRSASIEGISEETDHWQALNSHTGTTGWSSIM